jgi:uncharacterized 2Fe-2S/4Fe-4S cluster protein (DUF4445 family)
MKSRDSITASGATWTVPPDVAPGTTLLDALRDEGIAVPAECGGIGTCGLCAVRMSPAPAPSAADIEKLSAALLGEGWRLSCGAAARAGTVVHLPADAIRVPASARAKGKRRPEGGPSEAAPPRRAPAGGTGFSLAVDLGTTTVAAALVRLPGGETVAEGSAPNAQRPFGADVVSRIEYGSRGPSELARLRNAAAESIHAAAADACRAAGVPVEAIGGGAIACNPTMAHLLLGANPAPLGRAPFRLVLDGTVILAAKRIGFPGAPDALVTLLAAASATLGGDALGGAVALGFDRPSHDARLLVDVGTNTEMVLSAPGRRAPAAASAASGGAFEGTSISCGMRAEAGAVVAAGWSGESLSLEVAGGLSPRGLSGSGLIDLVALLRRSGIVDPSGRMRGRDELYGIAPPGLLGRLLPGPPGEGRFLVSRERGVDVTLSAADIRQFQLAKGAIRAALDLLVEEAGLAPGDFAEVALAGAFGAGIDEENAIAVGLFPEAFRGRFRRAGNRSLSAAVESVRDQRFPERVEAFSRRLRTLSLPGLPAFQERFLSAMAFPDRDASF